MQNIKKQVYSVREVSKLLGISRNLAYTLCRQKQLPGVIHLGKWRMMVSAAAIDRLLSGNNHNE
jgi:predicted DNA-binding transcriptional regulator AlpA